MCRCPHLLRAQAAAKITDDLHVLLACYNYPAEHWIHLRTTNPIESTFATDWLAVQAGFTVHWSSGPAEGNINRVKLIKRQIVGRAKFDLLRKRVLLAG